MESLTGRDPSNFTQKWKKVKFFSFFCIVSRFFNSVSSLIESITTIVGYVKAQKQTLINKNPYLINKSFYLKNDFTWTWTNLQRNQNGDPWESLLVRSGPLSGFLVRDFSWSGQGPDFRSDILLGPDLVRTFLVQSGSGFLVQNFENPYLINNVLTISLFYQRNYCWYLKNDFTSKWTNLQLKPKWWYVT